MCTWWTALNRRNSLRGPVGIHPLHGPDLLETLASLDTEQASVNLSLTSTCYDQETCSPWRRHLAKCITKLSRVSWLIQRKFGFWVTTRSGTAVTP